jgi:hypothetical protein
MADRRKSNKGEGRREPTVAGNAGAPNIGMMMNRDPNPALVRRGVRSGWQQGRAGVSWWAPHSIEDGAIGEREIVAYRAISVAGVEAAAVQAGRLQIGRRPDAVEVSMLMAQQGAGDTGILVRGERGQKGQVMVRGVWMASLEKLVQMGKSGCELTGGRKQAGIVVRRLRNA